MDLVSDLIDRRGEDGDVSKAWMRCSLSARWRSRCLSLSFDEVVRDEDVDGSGVDVEVDLAAAEALTCFFDVK